MFFDDFRRWQTWNPLVQMRQLQRDLNSILEHPEAAFRGAGYPALNVVGDDEKLVVTAEMPGVSPSDIDVSIVHDTLTIKGTRKAEELAEDEIFHRQERTSGTFVRTVALPYAVSSEKVKATYAQGVLKLELPRAESDKPKKISVKSE